MATAKQLVNQAFGPQVLLSVWYTRLVLSFLFNLSIHRRTDIECLGQIVCTRTHTPRH